MYSEDELGILAHSSCLFLEAMAEFERSLIQEHVRAGHAMQSSNETGASTPDSGW